jgi:hypothetical protein
MFTHGVDNVDVRSRTSGGVVDVAALAPVLVGDASKAVDGAALGGQSTLHLDGWVGAGKRSLDGDLGVTLDVLEETEGREDVDNSLGTLEGETLPRIRWNDVSLYSKRSSLEGIPLYSCLVLMPATAWTVFMTVSRAALSWNSAIQRPSTVLSV